MADRTDVDAAPVDAVVVRALTAGFERGDGSMEGAMQFASGWWHPKFGCDSLQVTLEWLQDELETLAVYSEGRCVCRDLRELVFGRSA